MLASREPTTATPRLGTTSRRPAPKSSAGARSPSRRLSDSGYPSSDRRDDPDPATFESLELEGKGAPAVEQRREPIRQIDADNEPISELRCSEPDERARAPELGGMDRRRSFAHSDGVSGFVSPTAIGAHSSAIACESCVATELTPRPSTRAQLRRARPEAQPPHRRATEHPRTFGEVQRESTMSSTRMGVPGGSEPDDFECVPNVRRLLGTVLARLLLRRLPRLDQRADERQAERIPPPVERNRARAQDA